jgi:hypothetical protein
MGGIVAFERDIISGSTFGGELEKDILWIKLLVQQLRRKAWDIGTNRAKNRILVETMSFYC